MANTMRQAEKKEIMNDEEASSSCSSSSDESNSNSSPRVSRVVHRMRKPTVRLGVARRSAEERQAEALALGMSFAAFATMVVENKSATGQNTNVADLALIYASAIKESLANVYGHKLGSFAERSFNNTLRILKVINDSAFPHQFDNVEKSKLEMGVSEAALRDESLITESEPYMGTGVMDWLVSSVIITLALMLYVSSVVSTSICMASMFYFSSLFSTSICMALEDQSSSWWQVSLSMLICRHRFWLQMSFVVLMILVATYLTIHRSSGTKQEVPGTLLLGIVCILSSMVFMDTFGAIAKLWIALWAVLCLLIHVADVSKFVLFRLLYDPIDLIQGTNSETMVPYWASGGIILVLLVLHFTVGRLVFAMFSACTNPIVTYAIESG